MMGLIFRLSFHYLIDPPDNIRRTSPTAYTPSLLLASKPPTFRFLFVRTHIVILPMPRTDALWINTTSLCDDDVGSPMDYSPSTPITSNCSMQVDPPQASSYEPPAEKNITKLDSVVDVISKVLEETHSTYFGPRTAVSKDTFPLLFAVDTSIHPAERFQDIVPRLNETIVRQIRRHKLPAKELYKLSSGSTLPLLRTYRAVTRSDEKIPLDNNLRDLYPSLSSMLPKLSTYFQLLCAHLVSESDAFSITAIVLGAHKYLAYLIELNREFHWDNVLQFHLAYHTCRLHEMDHGDYQQWGLCGKAESKRGKLVNLLKRRREEEQKIRENSGRSRREESPPRRDGADGNHRYGIRSQGF